MVKKQFFSDDELVIRLWDVEEIRDIMAKHCYCYSEDQRREELNELWVTLPQNRRTASLAFNNGYYVGMDDISNFYVVQNTELRYRQLKPYSDAFPDIGYNNLNLGIGIMNIHTCNTPVIYVADDGKTAKYMGYDNGLCTAGKPDGSADAYYIFGMTYADLVKENGEWKIWHLVLQRDHNIPAGKGYETVPSLVKPGEDPLDREFGTPTIQRIVHDPFYGWEHMYEDMPHAYYTYNSLHSYGPEGDMGMPFYEREQRGK